MFYTESSHLFSEWSLHIKTDRVQDVLLELPENFLAQQRRNPATKRQTVNEKYLEIDVKELTRVMGVLEHFNLILILILQALSQH